MLPTTLDRLLISAIPPRAGDVSKGSWPERVNHGVAMDFGFDFLRTRPFAGAIAHSQVAGLRMFSVTCEPHLVYRAPQHVTGSPDSHYLLTLQVTGQKGVEQYEVTEGLNDSPEFIQALAELVLERVGLVNRAAGVGGPQ